MLAENYCELLRAVGIPPIMVDVLALDSHRRFSGANAIYFWLLRKMPWLWRWLYQNWCNVPGIDWGRQWILPRLFPQTHHLLVTSAPALVISTHPVATAIVDYLKRIGRLETSLWVAISDWHIQPFWLFPSVDCYLVPTQDQQIDIEQIGVPKSNILVVGMLLRKDYYAPLDRELARAHLRLPFGARLIVAMGGGSGWGLEKIIEELIKLNTRLVVITGSAERQMQIRSYLRHLVDHQDLEVLGFVDPLLYLVAADLVITKPGGLSTAEVIQLRKPLILVEPMPGHEEENYRILSRIGICGVTNTDELLHSARAVLDNQAIPREISLRVETICSNTTPQLVLESICEALRRSRAAPQLE
ncbi:MAG TPA: glycosyltransferase [Blastocatellia bacterium]|nr:glycosyltransferase [Blastocatellia bacterium]